MYYTFNGWGGRVIFKIDHEFPYLLYGHLDPKSITVRVGDKVSANTVVGRLGDARVNGGWFTHLHVQQMRELWPGFDGYADACPRDIAKWRKMVCDPTLLL
jgi:murein DD-endopeptidase MepM/ murein hydrolase activator NlpD